MHVSRLRRKLAGIGPEEEQVKTIRGTGYQLLVRRNQTQAEN
jgi:two-component system response regulator CpxR